MHIPSVLKVVSFNPRPPKPSVVLHPQKMRPEVGLCVFDAKLASDALSMRLDCSLRCIQQPCYFSCGFALSYKLCHFDFFGSKACVF
jgi:hypothetical protein